MVFVSTVESLIDRAARMIALGGLIGLLTLGAVTVGEVLLRWIFNYPILGVFDVSGLAIMIAVASCFPLVFAQRRMITVRVLGDQLGPCWRALFEAFGNLASMALYLLMAWQLFVFMRECIAIRETTYTVYIPIAPWVGLAAALVILCIPVQAFCFVMDMRSAFLRKPHSEREADGHLEKIKRERDYS